MMSEEFLNISCGEKRVVLDFLIFCSDVYLSFHPVLSICECFAPRLLWCSPFSGLPHDFTDNIQDSHCRTVVLASD